MRLVRLANLGPVHRQLIIAQTRNAYRWFEAVGPDGVGVSYGFYGFIMQ